MIDMIGYNFKKIITDWKIWVSLTVSVLLGMLFYYRLANVATANSCETLGAPIEWLEEHLPESDILYWIWGPVFAAFSASLLYFDEKHQKTDIVIIPKCSRTKYYFSFAIVAMIISFVISALPLAVEYGMWKLSFNYDNGLFPYDSHPLEHIFDSHYVAISGGAAERIALNHPDAMRLIGILLFGLWGSLISLATYVFSLYIRTNSLITLVLPGVILTAFMFVAGPNNEMSAGVETYFSYKAMLTDESYCNFLIDVGVMIAICFAAVFLKAKGNGDVL